MLTSLHIENVAVIEKADIAFGSGFHVLTGETGAGKSIVIDALNAVLGERISRDLVRAGSAEAAVTALFEELSPAVLSFLSDNGFEPEEDGSLLISRRISAEGKGSSRLNGRPINVSVLRQLGRMLLNIHGQHENQNLLSPETHMQYLDRLGHLEQVREEYVTAYRRYCRIHKDLRACDGDEAQKERRSELLRFQIHEIEEASLTAGEETELLRRRDFYRHSEKIAAGVMRATARLYGDDDVDGGLTAIDAASRELMQAGAFDEELAALAQRLESLSQELRATADDIERYADNTEFDAADRDRVEERLELIRRLASKYGATTADILDFADSAREELSGIVHADERRDELARQLILAEDEVVQKAAILTASRRQAAERFSRDVMEELRFLDMPRVQFNVSIEPNTLTVTGGDRVEFMLSANPGEPVRSMARIASGGELSRIMLAIKSVMADVDEVETLVFDEIDTGISGRAAQKVGMKLRQTAESSEKRSRQVLCVTHLAQIASRAHHHLLIVKSVQGDRTYTEVETLDTAGREHELARIIGGELTQANLTAAREMLKLTEKGALS